MNRDEAIARSPLSVTLMVNSSGWEAVEVKGTESTDIQKIKVCLCECAHSLCVECSVSNRDLINEVKFNPAASTQYEKFFATMTDLGLKSMDKFVQPIQCDKAVRKDLLLSSCNQIAVSTVGLACNFESRNEEPIEVATSNSVCINENSTYPAGSSHENPPTKKTVDAFSLLRKACSSDGKGSAKTPVPFESLDRKSRPSTPLPMVAKKTTESSWTLFASRTEGPSKNSKSVPAYKRIPGTQFVVDAFKYGIIYGVKAYFLSHFHSDHYIGLKKGFSGPIFCSQVTANLVHLQLKVDKECLHILKIGEPRVVCGVEIEIFDANHCPGAIMILFRLLDGQTFLHVGDFRAHPSMEAFDQLRFVNKLYLDTTYCDKSYDFPPQDEVVNKVVQTVKEHLSQFKSTLIVCGTYTIGKEKVFLGIAEAFNLKIWTTTEKRKVLRCLEDANLNKRLTTDALSAQVHVLAMKDITVNELSQYLMKHSPRYSHCIGFKPTGWTTSKSLKGSPSDFQTTTLGKVTVYGVPYSEHSSFSELRRFVRHIKPKDIQVTVNLNKSTEYKKLFEKWLTSNRNDDSQLKMKQFFNSACSKTSC